MAHQKPRKNERSGSTHALVLFLSSNCVHGSSAALFPACSTRRLDLGKGGRTPSSKPCPGQKSARRRKGVPAKINQIGEQVEATRLPSGHLYGVRLRRNAALLKGGPENYRT